MQFQECLSEASGECWCRLCDSTLCTSKFCCKARKEVVLCLLWCQNRYWRQYAESICRQENNFFCCRSGRNRANNILDVVDRVRNTSVLCYALICKVDFSFRIKSYVLEKGIAFDCIVDVWLRLFVKVDNFCIASAFEVEYTIVIPAVLVITDKKTFRVCGKCSFSCSGKTEEDCCVFAV